MRNILTLSRNNCFSTEIPTRCCFKGIKHTPDFRRMLTCEYSKAAPKKKGARVKKRSMDRDPLSLRSTDHVGQLLLMTPGWLTDVSLNGTLEISPPTDPSWELPLLWDTWVYLKFQRLCIETCFIIHLYRSDYYEMLSKVNRWG